MKRRTTRRPFRASRSANPIETLEARTLLSAAYTLTDLGTLPGFNNSEATGINASGQVVGDVVQGNLSMAFLWTPGGTAGPGSNPQMLALGTLGGTNSKALGVNDQGQVVGWADDTDGNEEAFLWTPGGTAGPVSNPQMEGLGTLGGATSIAFAINNSGQVAGSADISGPVTSHAFLWTAGATNGVVGNPQMLDLGTLGQMPDIESQATDIADDGQVVGWADNDNFNPHPFLWTAGGTAGPASNPQMQDLGTLGATDGFANGINAAGAITGWSEPLGSSGNTDAFLWTADGTLGPVSNPQMQDLGKLGGIASQADAINDPEQIVGELTTGTESLHAFIWDNTNGMQDLNDISPVAMQSWILNDAVSINNSGEIVGDGVNALDSNAFLLVPLPPTAAFTSPPAAITAAGGASEPISVTYSSATAIDPTSIDPTDLTVTNSSGTVLTVTLTNIIGSGDSLIGTYAVNAPGGSWQASNNDVYTVTVNNHAVTDIDGNGTATISTTFPVTIPYTTLPTGNLLMNPGAEGGTGTDTGTVTNWTTGGDAPVGRDNGSLDEFTPHTGSFDFSAGEGSMGTLTQIVSLTSLGSAPLAAIDAGNTSANISFFEQSLEQTPNDTGEVVVTFQNASHAALSGGYDSGPIGNSGGWQNIVGSATIPAGARFITYEMVFTRNVGLDLDAFIDDNSLVIVPAAAPAGVDTSFAGGLPVSLPFSAEQVLQEPSGDILAVGHQGSTGNNTSQGVLEALTSAGAPDTNFGTGGMVATNGSLNAAFFSAAVQTNGQIVAVGGSNGSFLVARYNTNGMLDTSFGTGGYATVSFGAKGAATAASVEIEPDGTIIVGGQAGTVLALARFTSTGMLDSSFNPGGADDPAFPAGGQLTVGAAGAISQILIQNNGQILCEASTGSSVQVLRCGPDGSVDATFGSSGAATVPQLSPTDPNNKPITPGMAIQPGGAIVVGAETTTGGFGAIRILPTGQVDTTFGNNGIATASFGGSVEDFNAIEMNPANGEFLLVGTTNAGGTSQIALAAFNNDGTVNTTFGNNGQFTLAAPGTLGAQSVSSPVRGTIRPAAFHPLLSNYALASFQSDGKVIVAASGANSASVTRIPTVTPAQSKIGDFGKINKKNVKLAPFTLANGTTVTITLAGGTGTAFHNGNQVQLTLSGSVAVTIKTRGGTGLFTLSNVTETGNLKSFSAPAATLAGTLSSTGNIGTLKLAGISGVVISAGAITNLTTASLSGSVSAVGIIGTAKLGVVSGTLAAAQIRNLTATGLASATILAGANLGSDGELGGTGSAADSFTPGVISNLKVTGTVASSFIGAGVNPVDGLFGDGDDTLAQVGIIKAITIKGGIDSATKFESGAFAKAVHVPGKVLTAGNPQFIVVH